MTTIPFDSLPSFPVSVDLSFRDRTVFNTWKKVFIYFRNLNIKTEDLNLDFSSLSFQEKWDALYEFAFGEIEFRSKELEKTWAQLICVFFNKKTSINGILTEDEIKTVIQKYSQSIKLIAQFCKSSLWWAADFAAQQLGNANSEPWYSETSNAFVSSNLLNIFRNYAIDLDFLSFETQIASCKFQSLDKISPFPSYLLLSGQSSVLRFGSRTRQWNEFTKLVKLAISKQ